MEEADMRYQCRRQLFRRRPKNATMQGAILKKDPTRARLVVVDTKGLFSVESTCAKGENLAIVSLLVWQLIAISSRFVVVFQTI